MAAVSWCHDDDYDDENDGHDDGDADADDAAAAIVLSEWIEWTVWTTERAVAAATWNADLAKQKQRERESIKIRNFYERVLKFTQCRDADCNKTPQTEIESRAEPRRVESGE